MEQIYLLRVTTGNGGVEYSEFEYRDDAVDYGRFLVNDRDCSAFTIHTIAPDGAVATNPVEVYP